MIDENASTWYTDRVTTVRQKQLSLYLFVTVNGENSNIFIRTGGVLLWI